MPRISRVVCTKLNLNYGYLFDIQSEAEAFEWYKNVRVPTGVEEFKNAAGSREGGNPNGSHATKGWALAYLAGLKGISLVGALAKFNGDLVSGMERTLKDQGRIFVNSNGGYFGYLDSLQISDTKDVPIWVLPTEEIRIIKWPNGEHFYAKVGNADVVVDGKQKWGSKYDAQKAAEKFLRTL